MNLEITPIALIVRHDLKKGTSSFQIEAELLGDSVFIPVSAEVADRLISSQNIRPDPIQDEEDDNLSTFQLEEYPNQDIASWDDEDIEQA